MNTRYALCLNGLGLHDLDERILITDIQESVPKFRTTTVANARYDGLRVTKHTRESLSVTVFFLIREYHTARRKALCSDICAWAASGGWLTLNDRPNQRLHVQCKSLPAITSALRWTDFLSITFTAWETPYWQDTAPVSVHLDAPACQTVSAVMLPPGTAPICFLEAAIVNRGSESASQLVITAGDTVFRLSAPQLIPGDAALSIGYDDQGFLFIRSNNTSLLQSRTADSSDDLLLTPGHPGAITITCDQPVTASLKARGLYL